MPTIYLKETTTYNNGSVNVNQQTYTPSKLFKIFKHTFTSTQQGNIYIYKGKKNWSGSFIITTNNGSSQPKLKEAHVYYNHYDPEKTPLVLVFKFQNGYGSNLDRYYERSKFNNNFSTNGGQTVSINDLTAYTDENSILKHLLTENDSLDQPLTYQIEKTKGDRSNGNGNGNDKYNGGKIKVQLDSEGEPKLSANGFKCYKHTPANGNGHGDKKACVIYDGNVLLKKDGKNAVDGIQEQVYQSIIVYIGEKAKKTSVVNKKQIDVPLLIELTKNGDSNGLDYYVHKKSNSEDGGKYYWEKIPGKGNGEVLCKLLTDMGFGIKHGQPGYEKLKQILTTASVNGVGDGEGEDLSNKLKGIKGTKLKSLLEQQVGQSGSPKPTLLELLLRQIEFNLVDSVIVLLEKKDTDRQYDERAVSGVINKLQHRKEFNRINMGPDKNISVSDKTDNKGNCVKDYKYKLIEHNFSTLVSGLGQNGKSYFGIRFIIPSEKNEREYKQLRLYDNKNEPQNLEYKYYHNSGRNGGGTSNSDKVYVWFYNGSYGAGNGDPRPLMLCYHNQTYAPKDKESYFTQWAKVELNSGSGPTNECGCSQDHGVHTHQSDSNKLLHELDKVVKFLNQVNIKEGTRGRTNGQPHTYEVQTFKNQKIQIKVTCSTVGSDSPPPPPPSTCSTSISNISCYKKFVHKAAGMENGPGAGEANNGSGYRLGEVVYNGVSGNPKGTLNYYELSTSYKHDPLVGVTVYYYDHDSTYQDPLLIELEFKTNGAEAGTGTKEYYKLKPNGGSNGEKKWELDSKAQDSMKDPPQTQKQVNYLDGIRYSLKKVMKIYIDKQSPYDLCVSNKLGGTGNEYSNGNGKRIEVREYTDGECSKLKTEGYKCYIHKVSEIIENWFYYNR